MRQVVPFKQVDTKELYTLSAKGVAVSRGDVRNSDITPCSEWLREACMFAQLKKRLLFRNFGCYKPFRWGTVLECWDESA